MLLLLLTLCHIDLFAGARYQVLLIPDCPGALNDLAHSGSLHRILTHFTSQQSESHTRRLGDISRNQNNSGSSVVRLCAEPVCAVGQGVSALCSTTEGQTWIFGGYSLTGVSWCHTMGRFEATRPDDVR